MSPEQTVAAVGELGLLRLVDERIGRAPEGEVWGGDDTAVVSAPGPRLLLTTDLLVAGIDFELAWASGEDIGWKAAVANVSDVAAMGGRPTHALLTVGVAPTAPLALFEGLLEGLVEAMASYGVAVVGGDISEAGELSVGVSLMGREGEQVVLRSGARACDVVCVTGALGGAVGGLEALRRGLPRSGAAARLIGRQLRPEARLVAGEALAAAGARAMIDVSDGVALDLARLCDASGTGCTIRSGELPIDPDLRALEGFDPVAAALTGGEDFELLCALPADRVGMAGRALRSADVDLTPIGEMTAGPRLIDGRPLETWTERAWQHLRTS
ncbi:thiamine-phosphate kinase [soil metagenome]